GLRVGRVDPDRVEIAVRTGESAHDREALAGVFTHDERPVRLENAVRIFRIDDQLREIKRTPDHPAAFIALVPGRAAVIGNEERAVARFDDAIDSLRVGRRDRYREPAVRFLRETFAGFRRHFGPGRAAIRGAEQSTARRFVRTVAAGTERPTFPP